MKKKNIGVTRAKADQIMTEFLTRVEELNRDPDYLYRVERAAVFGSYLSDKPKLGDIDIAIELAPKCEDKDRQWALVHAQRERAPANVQNNFVTSIYWPKTRCYQFLKARSRAISLHEYAELNCLAEDAAERNTELRFATLFPVGAAKAGGGESRP